MLEPYIFFEESVPNFCQWKEEDLADLFESKKNTHFIYDNTREATLPHGFEAWIPRWHKRLEKSNSYFTYLVGGEMERWIGQTKTRTIDYYDRVNCIENHGYFIRIVLSWYGNYHVQKFSPSIDEKKETFMVYLNGKPHQHRCELMDLVQKTNLLEDSIWSWQALTSSFPFYENHPDVYPNRKFDFKHWNEEIKLIDTDKTTYLHKENFYQSNNQAEVEENCNYFIQLVSESSAEYFFLTEKVVKPLVHGKLFITSACKGYHKKLEELGFKLYDEIIDYSFDMLDDYKDRNEGIIKNLQNLKNQNYEKIYQTVKEKLIYNQKHCLKVATEYEYNKEIYDLIKKYQSTFDKLKGQDEKTIFIKSLYE